MADASKEWKLYHGTTLSERNALSAGLELIPRVTELGAHGPFYLAVERAPAIEHGHLRANDSGMVYENGECLLCTFILDITDLVVCDFGEPYGERHEEWKRFIVDNWNTTDLEPHPQYAQYDVIVSYMSNGEGELDRIDHYKCYDGSPVRQVGLCTEKALGQCRLVQMEEIPFNGWERYRPE